MRATLVVARGTSVYLLAPDVPPRRFEVPLRSPHRTGAGGTAGVELPPALLAELRRGDRSVPIVVGGRGLSEALAGLSRPLRAAEAADWHRALAEIPVPPLAAEREEILVRARADLDAALRSPEEVLISLAREEQRLERSVNREARASEAFVAPLGTTLAEVARAWTTARERLAGHHAELLRLLEDEARRVLPNLSAVLGPRTAARLLASAGGTAPLARMSASRLQLLGSRRRPSPERGPRYGAIYLAEALATVPEPRRAAFARSLAALAAIAARADVLTHRDLAAALERRRDARAEQLRRRRG